MSGVNGCSCSRSRGGRGPGLDTDTDTDTDEDEGTERMQIKTKCEQVQASKLAQMRGTRGMRTRHTWANARRARARL